MSARQNFVKGSGIFGKYLYRGMVYFGENAVAFLGLTLTIVALFSVSHVLGLTVPMMAAAASAAVASLAALPVLAGIVALAVAIAAPETLKKVYKECTEWVVAAYKNAMKNWFMPKDFTVSKEKANAKQVKYPKIENENDTDYAERLSTNRETKYTKIFDSKTADLDLAGMRGKKVFKTAANGIADGAEFVASLPGRAIASLPSFSFYKTKSTPDSKEEPLLGSGRQSPSLSQSLI